MVGNVSRGLDQIHTLQLDAESDALVEGSKHALSESAAQNCAVAAALLISPKTVEANLARTYQKFEIRSRAELGRRMGDARRSLVPPSSRFSAPRRVSSR